MASSPASRLTPLQRDLLTEFFAREKRMFLTGGSALGGFYLGHRESEDLDLFAGPDQLDLGDAERALVEATRACGAELETLKSYRDFRRFQARRREERCLVDLVIDRAPMLEPNKPVVGSVRLDSLREIAANKICTLLSRSEIKDLVDLRALVEAGVDLEQSLADAPLKDAGVEPATLAWVLDELTISPQAILPGGVDPAALDAFRGELVKRLRATAFAQARK